MGNYNKILRFSFLLMIAVAVDADSCSHQCGPDDDPAGNQSVIFKEKHPAPIGIMTTAAGAPIQISDTTILNRRPIFNEFFIETSTRLVRERIPERVVHAKGAGAFGYFEVTHDISDICKAKLFSKVGKRTPIAARFSPVLQERGGIDTSRDARGFALKFYTEDGNFDIVGFNTPVFVFKDPILFQAFVRSQKKNPATNLPDANTMWDYITLNWESLHILFFIFSDRGIPAGYRYMPGFGIHTFQVVNEYGDTNFVRFHFKPNECIKNLRSKEAMKIAASDPDYATRDLYRAIACGKFPIWKAYIQVLTPLDVQNAGFDVFDVTKLLPLDRYPLRPLGYFELNRNPKNYFAEIEQMAYSPANLVTGILGGPDKVFESRRLAYRDAQYHRLGANFYNIPVNCPYRTKAYPYNRDGSPPVDYNQEDIPNYYPNSFNGPVSYKERNRVELIEIYEDEPDNWEQIRELYINEMSTDERSRVVENILPSLRSAAKFLQERALKIFAQIHPDLEQRVQEGLQKNVTKCKYDLDCCHYYD